MKLSKKIIAVVIAALMAISMMPITALATDYTGGDTLDLETLEIGDTISGSYSHVTGNKNIQFYGADFEDDSVAYAIKTSEMNQPEVQFNTGYRVRPEEVSTITISNGIFYGDIYNYNNYEVEYAVPYYNYELSNNWIVIDVDPISVWIKGAESVTPSTPDPASEPYLTFTGTDSFSIKTYSSAKNWNGTLQYSTDANTWTTWNGTQISSVNDKLYLRGTGNTQIAGSSLYSWVITTQGTVACSGDIRTLLDYNEPESPDSDMGAKCFSYLFQNCTSLTAAPELPATRLAERCYQHMFYGCESLTTAPALPATTLAPYCYNNMFNGCTSLTTAPALPATAMEGYCYANMFNGCTSLTTAPELPATSLAPSCYNSMFQGCANLTTAPVLPATELAPNCYRNMFNGCTSLTTAPELPATTLAERCYSDMFYGCESLTTAPELPATELANYCYYNMFKSCRSLTTAPELPATTLRSNCYYSMFQNCTSLTTPSELPATDLTDFCYYTMFRGCTGIKLSTVQTAEYSIPYSIPEEGTGSMGSYSLTDMFTNTGGTFTGTPTINTTYYIPAPAPVYSTGFMVGSEHFDTLDEAIAGSASGDTITALSDIDFTVYPSFTRHTFDLSGRTLDLDGHTVTTYNHSVVYVGDNFTIKNGTINCIFDTENNKKPSYAVVVYPQVGSWQNDTVEDWSDNVVLENLNLTGGINAFGANVTVQGENTNVAGNYYYAVWADVLASITVKDGTYTSTCTDTNGVIGAWYGTGKLGHVDIEGGDFTVPAGKNLILQSTQNSATQLVEISGGSYNVPVPAKVCAEGFVPVTEPNAQGKYTVGVPNNGANITVADTISENFYLDDEFYGESAYVSVNYNHNSNASETSDFRTDVQSMASLPELDDNKSPYDGARKLSVIQAPAQSTEPITIKVYATQADAQAGTNAIDTIEYSVYNYCRQILEGEYTENLKELAESTLDYAAAAQTYFNYNTDNMATVDATGDFYNNVAGADLSSVAGVSAAPSCITKASVVVKSDLEINLYSLTPIEVTGYNLEATKGGERFTATTGEKNGDYYCVHISGIDAANMNKTITVNTSEGEIVMTANSIIKMMAGSSNANLSTLAKAMYLYGVAASEYFG